MSNQFNMDQLVESLPKRMRKGVNNELLVEVNRIIADPILGDDLRNNIVDYVSVLDDGKYKISDYLNAVRYVTNKLTGASNIRAYTAVFPDRMRKMIAKGLADKNIAGVVSVYNKRQLVNKIMAQSLIPVHVLNQGLHQKAINKLADLMMNANSEKVQSDSAAKLVDALKAPETQKIELDVSVKEDNSIQELRASTMALVAEQKKMLQAGAMTAQEVAHSKLIIIDGESSVIDNKQ